MKIKRGRRSRKARIEIIPMIDVMFFLLATFMLASLAMQNYQGIAINLAHGDADKINANHSLFLNIDAANQVFLNQRLVKMQDLNLALKQELQDPERLVIIAADQKSSQGVVMAAMLEAKKVGAHHFSMIVRQ